MTDHTPKGTVKWFSREKGYGFISRESGEDVFLHILGWFAEDYPMEGQEVEFLVEQKPKGPQATKCRPAGEPEPQLFAFITNKSVKNATPRGPSRSLEGIPSKHHDKVWRRYAGMFGDPEGKTPVDRSGHRGYMAKWRIRALVRGGLVRAKIFDRTEECQLYGSTSTFTAHVEMSPAEMLRYLDGLPEDQCPLCHKELSGPEDDPTPFGRIRRCECGYTERV